jgi:hypothetical protein
LYGPSFLKLVVLFVDSSMEDCMCTGLNASMIWLTEVWVIIPWNLLY